jgi:hypothetical protein
MIDLRHALAVLSSYAAAIAATVTVKRARQALAAHRVRAEDLLGANNAEFGDGSQSVLPPVPAHSLCGRSALLGFFRLLCGQKLVTAWKYAIHGLRTGFRV